MVIVGAFVKTVRLESLENDEQRRDLLEIIEDRYEKRSTLITLPKVTLLLLLLNETHDANRNSFRKLKSFK